MSEEARAVREDGQFADGRVIFVLFRHVQWAFDERSVPWASMFHGLSMERSVLEHSCRQIIAAQASLCKCYSYSVQERRTFTELLPRRW